jgi:hypothetical protein
MSTIPDTWHRPSGPTGARRRALPRLLLTLLGILSVTSFATGGSVSVGASMLHATTAAAAGDSGLLRSTFRLPGLHSAQPLCKGDDGDDTAALPTAVATSCIPAGRDIAAAKPHPAPMAASRLRPLHGQPQSPRAPPHLA